ncbi:kinase-like domain-containing protein [Aspergillus similis]
MPIHFQPFARRLLKADPNPHESSRLLTIEEPGLFRVGYGRISEPGRKLSTGSVTHYPKELSCGHSHNLGGQMQSNNFWGKISGYVSAKKRSSRTTFPLGEWEHWAARNLAERPGEPSKMRAITQKYGELCQVTGLGAHAIILQSHKEQYCPPLDCYYALKLFRRRPGQTKRDYQERVVTEFAIVSQLHHKNIITVFELLPLNAAGDLCACMEFCAGGDLHSLIVALGELPSVEADCLFKQIIRGIVYLHEMGVAHRDLKPENLLLTSRACLKISDFGNAERFRLDGEDRIKMSTERCGSAPYISPEQYREGEFDPRGVDLWAAAVIYIAMRTGRNVWKEATKRDECFQVFAERRKIGKRSSVVEDLCQVRASTPLYVS